MTVQTAACIPDACAPVRKPAAAGAIAAVAAKIHEAFAVLHDVQWRAPWDEAGRRRIDRR